jgi:hypothetical protein
VKLNTCLLLLITIAWISSCERPQKDPHQLVPVRGISAVSQLSPVSSSPLLAADSGQWRYLPFRANDVYAIWFGNQHAFFMPRLPMPDSLNFTFNDSLVYLDQKLYQFNMTSDSEMGPFLENITETDIRSLKSVYIEGGIHAKYKPALEKIARINPSLGFMLVSDSLAYPAQDLQWLAGHFSPPFLVVEVDSASIDILASFRSLKNLQMQLQMDSHQTTLPILPAIPSLKTLTVTLDNEPPDEKTALLSLNSQLECVSLGSNNLLAELTDKPRPALKRLYLTDSDSLKQISFLADLPGLETIHIGSPLSANFNLEHLKGGQKFKEMAFNGSIRQEQLNQILADQTELIWLEINSDDSIVAMNYTPLNTMKKLKYLTLGGMSGNVESLESMKNLAYLSLPLESAEDSLKLAQLEKALPNTRITPNTGFCMGSGWILIIWPVLLLMLFLLNPRLGKQKAA